MANSKLCKELTILFPKDKIDELYIEAAKLRLSPGKFIRKVVLDYLEKSKTLKYTADFDSLIQGIEVVNIKNTNPITEITIE